MWLVCQDNSNICFYVLYKYSLKTLEQSLKLRFYQTKCKCKRLKETPGSHRKRHLLFPDCLGGKDLILKCSCIL